jgi:hypothetical protein
MLLEWNVKLTSLSSIDVLIALHQAVKHNNLGIRGNKGTRISYTQRTGIKYHPHIPHTTKRVRPFSWDIILLYQKSHGTLISRGCGIQNIYTPIILLNSIT